MIYWFYSFDNDNAKYKIKKTGMGIKKNNQVSGIDIERNKISDILNANNSEKRRISVFFLENTAKSKNDMQANGMP